MFYKLGSVVDYCETDDIIDVILTAMDDNELTEYLKCEDGKLYFDITIGNCNWYEDYIDANDILEDLSNKCYEESGDIEITDYLENISKEHVGWFQDKLDKLWKEFKEKAEIHSPFFTFLNEHDYRVYINENYEFISFEEHYEILVDFSNIKSTLKINSLDKFDNKLYISSTKDLYIYNLEKNKFQEINDIECFSFQLGDCIENSLSIEKLICYDKNKNMIAISEDKNFYILGSRFNYECVKCDLIVNV